MSKTITAQCSKLGFFVTLLLPTFCFASNGGGANQGTTRPQTAVFSPVLCGLGGGGPQTVAPPTGIKQPPKAPLHPALYGLVGYPSVK